MRSFLIVVGELVRRQRIASLAGGVRRTSRAHICELRARVAALFFYLIYGMVHNRVTYFGRRRSISKKVLPDFTRKMDHP